MDVLFYILFANKQKFYKGRFRIMDEKEIEINGCIEIPNDITMDEVIDKFIEFVESNGWYFGGGFRKIINGHYINDDGSLGKHIMDE